MRTKVFFPAWLLALLFVPTFMAAAEENLVKNPSFEAITVENKAENWFESAWIKDRGVSDYKVETLNVHTGKNSVSITNSKENHSYYIQDVDVEESALYRFSAWIRTENVGNNGGGAGINLNNHFEQGGELKGTNDWKPVELYITTSKNVKSLRLLLCLGNYAALNTGKVWFDDIALVRVTEIPNGALSTVSESPQQNTGNKAQGEENKDAKPLNQQSQGGMIFFIIAAVLVIFGGIIYFLVIRKKKEPEDNTINLDETPKDN